VAYAKETGCQKLGAMVAVVAGASAVIRANRMYTIGGDTLGPCGYLIGVSLPPAA
jgi:hypothetical protein